VRFLYLVRQKATGSAKSGIRDHTRVEGGVLRLKIEIAGVRRSSRDMYFMQDSRCCDRLMISYTPGIVDIVTLVSLPGEKMKLGMTGRHGCFSVSRFHLCHLISWPLLLSPSTKGHAHERVHIRFRVCICMRVPVRVCVRMPSLSAGSHLYNPPITVSPSTSKSLRHHS